MTCRYDHQGSSHKSERAVAKRLFTMRTSSGGEVWRIRLTRASTRITHLCNQSGVRRAGATRVLVVDDYRGATIATATYLSLDGMEARVAGGCGDALEAVINWLPDVVLLDVWMPQRDASRPRKQ